MLLSNGRIYTLDPGDRVVDTLVVRAGRVVFAGRRRDVNVPAGESEIDLGGRAVLPGLVDAHGHLMYLARLRLALDVAGLASEAACAGRVAARAASARPGEWIAGRGWDQNRWPGARFPTRASLDRAAPEHPVALVRVDGHALWVSSTALRIAGIGRHTPDPPGGPPRARPERRAHRGPGGYRPGPHPPGRAAPGAGPAGGRRAGRHRGLSRGRTHRCPRDGGRPRRPRRLPPARRGGGVPVPEPRRAQGRRCRRLAGGARRGSRPGGRWPRGRRRGEADGGRRAGVPRRGAPRAVLRRPGESRAPPAAGR